MQTLKKIKNPFSLTKQIQLELFFFLSFLLIQFQI